MNDNERQLIEQLAAKLGTTADHLWGVLLRQAPIEAVVDLFYVGFVVVLFFVARSFHRWACADERRYDDWVIGSSIAWGAWCIFALIVMIVISELPTLFLNPEYWALKEVLHAVRK